MCGGNGRSGGSGNLDCFLFNLINFKILKKTTRYKASTSELFNPVRKVWLGLNHSVFHVIG